MWCSCLLQFAAARCSLCVVNCCRLLFVACRWCGLPLAVADCCMSCIECCAVVSCGRDRRFICIYMYVRTVAVVYNVSRCTLLFCCLCCVMVVMLFAVCCCGLLLLCVVIAR